MANRAAPFTQADITRAVKGTVAAGLTVREVFASADGVRVIVAENNAVRVPENSFDAMLGGAAK